MQTPFGRSPVHVDMDPAGRSSFHGRQRIGQEMPEFADLVLAVAAHQHSFAGTVLRDDGLHLSLRLLFVQAVNDFTDWMTNLSDGAGRSAMRAARALLEHGVNAHTITSDLRQASLYLEHLDLGAAIAMDIQPGTDLLRGNAAKAHRHRLNRAGNPARRRFEAAVAEHGTWFRRGWAQRNLRDRARAAGLEDLYEYYRLVSLIAHGASGGTLGSTRDLARHPGKQTLRVGPALELAPIAYLAGLRGYREVLNALGVVVADAHAYIGGLDVLELWWPEYYAVVTKIDEELWPTSPVRPPGTVCAFARDGSRRWFLHLPHHGLLVPALAPELDPDRAEHLDKIIRWNMVHRGHLFTATSRYQTIDMEGIRVAPDHSRRPVPDTAFLVVPEDDFKVIRVDDLDDAPQG